jgi:GH24 family phage-related lysozyme (muramidase)
MPPNRIPGPVGTDTNAPVVDEGTKNPTETPPPVPTGAGPNEQQPAQAGDKKPAAPAALDYDDVFKDMKEHEGMVPYMYLDTVGKVTIGVGNMLPDAAAAKKLAFTNKDTGKPATQKEIEDAFAAVSKMDKGKLYTHYKQKPSLELDEETIKTLALDRIKDEFEPGVKKIYPGYDNYPPSAKRALIDMAYNLGTAGLEKFKKLKESAELGEWEKASEQCSRKGIQETRNTWTKEMFKAAAEEAKPGKSEKGTPK